MPRQKRWSVPVRITVPGHNREDGIKQANEALADGLIEPGFVEDAAVDDGEIFELEPLEKD